MKKIDKNKESSPRAHSSRLVASYYWNKAKKYPGLLIGVVWSIPLTVLINNYLPALIVADVLRKLADTSNHGAGLWDLFGVQVVAYGVLLILGIGAWRIVDFYMWRLEQRAEQDIAEEVFDHMLRRSSDFHANNFGGTLVSRANKLMYGYVRTADVTIFQVYPMLAGLIIVAVILAPKAPIYVVGLLVFAVVHVIVAIKVSKKVRRKSEKFAEAESAQTGKLSDAITNVMAIKSFAQGAYEMRRFHSATSKTRRRLESFARMHQKQMMLLGSVNRIISAFALFAAVVAVLWFDADIGTVFLIISYTMTSVDMLFRFSNESLRAYSRAFGDAKEMAFTLTEPYEIRDPDAPETVSAPVGTIRFKDVTFKHKDAATAIFKELNIDIAPGEKVGLVGHSGSGKSTFTKLLLRFSDIKSGEILIDGQNNAHITQDDLHRKIAYVPQEPLLFHRSIRENIAYGNKKASDQEIDAVVEMAHVKEFVDGLPEGLETLVGERGVKLSGGQRQRIAIARAMLKNAPILVLDEATSALDSESEVLIQKALWSLMRGRTTIVIAHRLSTIQKMDRIVVLDNGNIVEQGTHKELLERKGNYARLWKHQSGGFLDEEVDQ